MPRLFGGLQPRVVKTVTREAEGRAHPESPVLRHRNNAAQENTPPTPLEGGTTGGCALQIKADRSPECTGRTPAPLLEARGVSRRFGSRKEGAQVLQGVDLSLFPGEVTALVGPSGAGKTTLLHILAGLVEPDSGEAAFLGVPLPLVETCRGRGRMSLVFQDPYAALASHLRVRQIVAEPLKIRSRKNVPDPVIGEALSLVRLTPVEEYIDRFPAQLSGGQRQRVAIARALVTNPALLLADEPTSMLDASAGVGILNCFRDIAGRGASVLVTIHDLAAACYVADRILVLSDGMVVEGGTPRELLAHPHHPTTQGLIQAAKAQRR
jgi:ABC-type glutathione transport system ATPase component